MIWVKNSAMLYMNGLSRRRRMIKKDYNLGLDIGATSVGFAGIDEQYDPIKLKGKTVVGVNLFEEGKTAADRRGFRTTRRRLSRRKWRLSLLEEFFDPYITPVDPTFFARLKESNLSPKIITKILVDHYFFLILQIRNFMRNIRQFIICDMH